jgi:hypothetical protein
VHGYHVIKRVEPNMDDIIRPWGYEQLLHRSVVQAFEAKFDAAEIIFLPALDLVPIR